MPKNTYIRVADRGLPMCNCGKNRLRLLTEDHIKSKNHQSYLKSLEIVNRWLSIQDFTTVLTNTA
jgi:hypothetical protein